MQMPHDTILAALRDVIGDHGYAARSVDISGVEHATAHGVEALVDRAIAVNAHGWIARQSGVVVLPGQDDLSLGAVVEAEWSEGSVSIQVRRLAGRWLVTTLTEVEGGDMLSDDIVHVTTDGRAARYRRYWRMPTDGAAEITAWRLVGLEDIA
jgi:hypothetical protein